MRVLHVYRTAYPDTQGGLEEVIRQICVGTHRLGVENRVFSLCTQREPWVIDLCHSRIYRVQQHLEVASCNMAFRGWRLFRALVDWADVIHYHFPWPFADVLHLANSVSKPALVTYHSDIIRQKRLLKVYEPLMHRFLSSMDVLVATSPNYAQTSAVLQRYRAKVKVIPLGVDESTYPGLSDSELVAYEQKWGNDFLLFVGVLRYYKGLHILLDALKVLAEKGLRPTVLIAGKGPEAEALKAQRDHLELSHVRFLGFVTDKEKVALYRLCQAVLFPSQWRSEAFGVTLIEAAMHGKPMISTELGTGTSYVNNASETGLVVPPNSPDSLAESIETLLENEPRRQVWGMQARSRYEALFTGRHMCQAYLKIYEALISRI